MTEDEMTAAALEAALNPEPIATIAGPRTEAPREPYTGADLKREPARAGSLHAYSLPSLQGGRETPRVRPFSNARQILEPVGRTLL